MTGSPSTRFTYFGFKDYIGGVNNFTTAVSDDGLHWTNAGGSWPDHAGVLNAPMILQYKGVDYLHVSETWGAADRIPWIIGTHNSSGVVSTIATINWTGKISGISATNSGEWFVESDGSVHLIIPAGPNSPSNPVGFQMYETHGLQTAGGATCVTASVSCPMTFWSDPVFVEVKNIGGASDRTDIYDPKPWKVGSTYYLWMTHEDDRCIELASASTLLGPYTMQRVGDWAGWGCNWEGPTLYRPTGAGSWRIALESLDNNPAGAHIIHYSDCNNNDFLTCTWTSMQRWSEDIDYRHGSIVGPNF